MQQWNSPSIASLKINMALKLSGQPELCVICIDPRAISILTRISEVMQLCPASLAGRNFYLHCEGTHVDNCFHDALTPVETIVIDDPPENENSKTEWIATAMHRVANRLARRVLEDGGILLHAALAVRNGYGVLFAAESGTGKTTASNRLPTPWRSLSDDAALVLQEAEGFRVHPWPTWSHFYLGNSSSSWNVKESVPLKGIFLLKQSQQDSVEPVSRLEAFQALIAAYDQVSILDWNNLTSDYCRERRTTVFHTVSNIVQAVPVYRLHLSLDGSFWELIESIL